MTSKHNNFDLKFYRRVESRRSFEEECCTAPQIDALAHTTTCLIGRNERTPTWDDQSQSSIEVSKCFETLILNLRERFVKNYRRHIEIKSRLLFSTLNTKI